MKSDRILFVCILLLAAVYLYATEQIPDMDIGDPMGSKAIPRFLGGALLLTAVLLFIEMRAASKLPKNSEPVLQQEAEGGKSQWQVVTALVAWTALYFAVFEGLGYAIATTFYLSALMLFFNRGKLKTNLLTAVLFSFGSYLAFTKLFGTPLAPGLLPF